MPRALVIGNGRMLINFDARLAMRDLYYPHVGMMNQIGGHRVATGVWADGRFSWLDGPGWSRELDYEDETLVTDVVAHNPELEIELQIHDAVHVREDLYLKRMVVCNRANRRREVRLFFTHDFSIDLTDIGDTVLYDLSVDAMMHYKRDTCLLMSGQTSQGGIFQYATGTKRFGGAEGTWRDAEDGWLEGNPIAQGSVDSVFSLKLVLDGGEHEALHYWIAAGSRFEEVRQLHARVMRVGLESLLEETRAYWRSWVNKKPRDFRDLGPAIERLYKRSLLIVRTQIDRGGAILAANDSDILQYNRDHYSYMWPRDGALVAYALDLAGYPELTRPFFTFAADALSPGGFLWHKYNPDGSVGSSWHPWTRNGEIQLPIQEDETALVLFALWHFYRNTRDIEFVQSLYDRLIKPAADFLVSYRDEETGLPLESYDLWEERRGVFTFTCAAVWAGLRAAGRFAGLFGQNQTASRYLGAASEVREAILNRLYSKPLGRFLRGFYTRRDEEALDDPTVESSLLTLSFFGLLPHDDERIVSTVNEIREALWVKTDVGGVARYERDYYHRRSDDFAKVPGNPWLICTMWLARYEFERARTRDDLARGKEILNWVAEKATSAGMLSEQLDPFSGGPTSVSPLTWSHSNFVTACIRYLEQLQRIEEGRRTAFAWHASPFSS